MTKLNKDNIADDVQDIINIGKITKDMPAVLNLLMQLKEKYEKRRWTKEDTKAIKQYKKDFESGKIPATELTGNTRDLWTDRDTAICERAEASGQSIWIKTGEGLSWDELKTLADEFDGLRDKMTVEEFMKFKGIGSKPFEFGEK